jgi:hypothetical protein
LYLRQLALVGIAALAVAATTVAQVGASAQQAPPTPPPPNSGPTPGVLFGTPVPAYSPPTIATPTPAPTSAPARGRHRHDSASPAASPSETPEPPQFSSLNGVWEVALQPLNGSRTIYSHLYVTQKGDQISGTWVRAGTGKKGLVTAPFTGTFDGRLFKLSGTDPQISFTLAGYVENFSDMVGMLTATLATQTGTPAPGIPFTADHRKASKDKNI